MDYLKTGQLIRKLRKEQGLNQTELAEKLHITGKTVSKWECGRGFPDVSMFPALSAALQVDFAALFSGELSEKVQDSGNLKRLQFYICPQCGNLITTTSSASVVCCGKVLAAEKVQTADDELNVELVEREYIVQSNHEMSREHYISFIALRSGDQLYLRKLYPEWDIQLQIPYIPGALMLWYCTKHGLFQQSVPQPIRAARSRCR